MPSLPAVANDLLRRYVAQRDPAVLGDLFVATAPHLLRTAMRATRDRALAEDALQDAFLAVFQDRARFDAQRAALPWLRGVVTQKARQVARRQAVRRRGELPDDLHELAAAPSAALAGEDRDRLRQALDRLPQGYRVVVERRFLLGDVAPDIAHDLDLANASVRSRLQRGLRMLRQSLRSVLAVLLALFAGRRGHAAQGLSVAGAVAALATLVIWLSPRSNEGAAAPTRTTQAAATATATTGTPATADAIDAIRRLAPPAASTAPAALANVARLQFADGSPAARVGLRWSRPGEDFTLGVRRLHTDADGRVTLPMDVALPLEVRTDRGPVVVLVPEAPVVVPVTGPARDLVVCDAAGRPVADARVWLSDAPGSFDGAVVGSTGGDGRIALRSLPEGSHVAAFATDGRVSTLLAVRGEGELRLPLGEHGRMVAGRVVDGHGRPLPGARVGPPGGSALQPVLPGNLTFAGRAHFVVETTNDGSFAVAVTGDHDRLLVVARGHVPVLVAPSSLVTTGVVALAAAPRLDGRVTRDDGSPLADVAVRVRGATWFARAGAFTDASGAFSFDALPPGPTEVEFTLRGHELFRRSLALPPSGETRLDVVLTPRSMVQLRVRDGGGGAVPGVEAGATGADRRPSHIARSDRLGVLAVERADGHDAGLLARRGRHSPWVALSADDIRDGTVVAERLGTARVLVEVVDVAGQPVPLLGIACRDALGESLLPVTRVGDRWRTGLLPPGDCELRLLPGSSQVAATALRITRLAPGEERDLGIVPLPEPLVRRIEVAGEGLTDESLLFVLRDASDAVLATAVGVRTADLTAPPGTHRLDVFGEHTEWRMGLPMSATSAPRSQTVELRPGRRRVLVLDEELLASGDTTVTIERIDIEPAHCVFVDRRRDRAATRHLEPVLGAGTFALTVRAPSVTPHRTTFVLDVDCEHVTVPRPSQHAAGAHAKTKD